MATLTMEQLAVASGANPSSLSITTRGRNNLLLLCVLQNASATGNNVSSVGGAGGQWSLITSHNSNGTTGWLKMYWAAVGEVGATTITVAYSSNPGGSGGLYATEISYRGYCAWAVVTSGHRDNTSQVGVPYPSLTTDAADDQLAVGYAFCVGQGQSSAGSGATGDTFTYTATSDLNLTCYRMNTTLSQAEAPVGYQGTQGQASSSIMAVMAARKPGVAGPLVNQYGTAL